MFMKTNQIVEHRRSQGKPRMLQKTREFSRLRGNDRSGPWSVARRRRIPQNPSLPAPLPRGEGGHALRGRVKGAARNGADSEGCPGKMPRNGPLAVESTSDQVAAEGFHWHDSTSKNCSNLRVPVYHVADPERPK